MPTKMVCHLPSTKTARFCSHQSTIPLRIRLLGIFIVLPRFHPRGRCWEVSANTAGVLATGQNDRSEMDKNDEKMVNISRFHIYIYIDPLKITATGGTARARLPNLGCGALGDLVNLPSSSLRCDFRCSPASTIHGCVQ